MLRTTVTRTVAATVTTVLLAAGLTAATTGSAEAVTTISTKYLLNHLTDKGEHPAGYERTKFTLWIDADHDGCDTRDEVLITEATKKPHVGSSCKLTDGRWKSKYDGVTTTNSTSFDIDHLVPLNEVWQSGAWEWVAATRKAYANDLGYSSTLIAVTAHENRSKGDREPQDWMPERTAYACKYLSQWVAVKWRWHLGVSASEEHFLRTGLKACDWPKVSKPSRPAIVTSSTGGTPTPTPTASSTPTPPPPPAPTTGTVSYTVTPGAFCSEHGGYGHTSTGLLMHCVTSSTDSRYRWRSA